MHPLLQDALLHLGRVGVRAAAAAGESVLADIQKAADNVSQQTGAARKHVRKISGKKKRKREENERVVIDAEIVEETKR